MGQSYCSLPFSKSASPHPQHGNSISKAGQQAVGPLEEACSVIVVTFLPVATDCSARELGGFLDGCNDEGRCLGGGAPRR